MKYLKYLFCLITITFLSACINSGGIRIDSIPMYGQPEVERPEQLKKADDDFINNAVSGFGTREKASKAWWAQAEKYMREDNLDYAMRRYNQSWLLNPDNYQPYWGFARIQFQLRKVDDAIKYMERAEALIDDPYQKVALLSDMGAIYSVKGLTQSSYFEKANNKFAESTKLDPEYPASWRRWAISLYDEGKYKEAWVKVKKAQDLNAKLFPKSFISQLQAKMPSSNQ